MLPLTSARILRIEPISQLLRRVLVPFDLARVRVYAPHVQTLADPHSCTHDPHIHFKYAMPQTALQTFLQLLSAAGEVFFANIRRLSVEQLATPYLSALLGPHVEMMRVDGDQVLGDPRTLQALRSIPRRCPQLNHVVIGGRSAARVFLDVVAELVPALENLTTFIMPCSSMPTAVLRAFASSPSLKYLHIALTEVDDSLAEALATSAEANHPAFNGLAQLTLEVTSPEHALQFLALVSSRRLGTLAVYYATVPDAQQVEVFFTALASHPCRRKLYALSLQAPWQLDISARRLTNSTFTPLFKLRLRYLTLDFFVDIDDEGLIAVAKAWPDMERLSLGVKRWLTDHPPRATILGLLALIEHCPRIVHIGYRMQTSILRSYDAIEFNGRPGNGIVTDLAIELEVGDSRIHDSIEVASFLSDICPKLWYIGCLWKTAAELEEDDEEEIEGIDIDDEEDMRNKWDEVVVYIPHFALVRGQERNRLR